MNKIRQFTCGTSNLDIVVFLLGNVSQKLIDIVGWLGQVEECYIPAI